MKKFSLFTIILLLIYLFLPINANAEEVDFNEVISSLIDALDGENLNEELNVAWDELDLEGNTFKEKILSVINGDFAINYTNVFSAILGIIFSSLRELIPLMLCVCAISLLYSLLKSFSPDGISKGSTKIVYFACYGAILGLLIYKTFDITNDCFSSITTYAKQMDVVFPLILTLMSVTGATVSASVYQPAVAFLSTGITGIFTSLIIPIITFLIIFSAVSGISQAIKTEKLSQFLSSVVKWVMGICITVFTMFLSVQGFTAGAYDGITLRLTKYAISNSVPIVGGFLRDGVDMFIVGGVLVKNAVGVCGLILMISTFLGPVVSLIAFSLFLKLSAGLIEPFSEDGLPNLLISISKSLSFVLASTLIVGFMYVITVILLICTGGAFL